MINVGSHTDSHIYRLIIPDETEDYFVFRGRKIHGYGRTMERSFQKKKERNFPTQVAPFGAVLDPSLLVRPWFRQVRMLA
jgi:hypothetical protein